MRWSTSMHVLSKFASKNVRIFYTNDETKYVVGLALYSLCELGEINYRFKFPLCIFCHFAWGIALKMGRICWKLFGGIQAVSKGVLKNGKVGTLNTLNTFILKLKF